MPQILRTVVHRHHRQAAGWTDQGRAEVSATLPPGVTEHSLPLSVSRPVRTTLESLGAKAINTRRKVLKTSGDEQAATPNQTKKEQLRVTAGEGNWQRSRLSIPNLSTVLEARSIPNVLLLRIFKYLHRL